MLKWAGKLAGKAQISKENTVNKFNSIKQGASDNFSSFKNNVSDPKAYMQRKIEEGKIEARLEEEKRKAAATAGVVGTVGTVAGTALTKNPEAGAAIGSMAGGMASAGANKKIADEEAKLEKERLKQLRDSGRNVGGPGGGSSGEGGLSGLGGIFILAIIAHILDAIRVYRPFDMLIVGIYLAILVIALLSFFREVGSSSRLGFLACVVLSYALPRAVSLFNVSWQKIILGLFFFLPFIMIYIIATEPQGSKLGKGARIWVGIYILCVLLWAVVSFGQGLTTIQSQLKVTPIDGVKTVATGLGKATSAYIKNIFDPLNRIMCPECGAESEDEQRGIYLENLKSTDATYYTGSDVFVQGRIRAKNINGTIKVSTMCFVPGEKQGKLTPATVSLTYNDENYLDCDLGQLKAGSKEVKFVSTFEYETDSVITYTFMDKTIVNALNMQNNELNQKFNIPERAVATYTGGPVEVGLPQLTQPFKIDPKDPNSVTYPFGVSLTNRWTNGKIVKGLYYKLEVPSTITLQGCNRKVSKSEKTNDANIYTFSIDDASVQETFDSVTCRMNITEEKVGELLGTGTKSVQTFVAKVRYMYSIEASTYVTVQKI